MKCSLPHMLRRRYSTKVSLAANTELEKCSRHERCSEEQIVLRVLESSLWMHASAVSSECSSVGAEPTMHHGIVSIGLKKGMAEAQNM
jgi:hypothetical protein